MEFKNLFSVRELIRPVEQWKTPQYALLRLFFREEQTHPTPYVEINFMDQPRAVAPYVHRRGSGQTLDKTGYKKFAYEPPYIKPRKNIEPGDLWEAMQTEHAYSERSPGQRLVELRNQKLMELEHSIQRREELQARDALFDGEIKILDDAGNELGDTIEFPRDADMTFEASPAWNSSGADPLEDLREAERRGKQRTGLSLRVVVMGRNAAKEFLNNEKVQNLLDNRRMEFGQISMERMEQMAEYGVTYIGNVDGFEIWRYDEWYLDPQDGEEKELIPENKVLVGAARARTIRHYGAIETLDAAALQGGMQRARRWPQVYLPENQDPQVIGLQLHSAPLMVPHQPNAFAVITTQDAEAEES